MHLGSDKTPLDKQNKRVGASVAAVILLLAMVFTVFAPVVAIAEGEEAPAQELIQEPVEAPAVVVVPPTTVPVPPTAVPTAIPVIPIAVPTQVSVPPTQVPTVAPTAVPPTAVPTTVPTQEPTAIPAVAPTEQVWINSDSLRITDGVTSHTVNQGGSALISITYNVTTPRTGTTIHARLSGSTNGWTIALPQLPDADPAVTSAAWTQTSTLQPGTSFTLPIIISAPATVAQDHAVSLQLWSNAAGKKGQETGVDRTDLRLATVTVLAPPPTPMPTLEPTQEPTAVPTFESAPEIEEPMMEGTPAPVEVAKPQGYPVSEKAATSDPSATPVASVLGVTASKDELEGSCVQEGTVNIPDHGIAAKIRCDYSAADGKIKLASQGKNVPVVTLGWEFGVTESGDLPTSWMSVPGNNAFGSNDNGSFYIYLKPRVGTSLPATGELKLRVETTNGRSGFPVEFSVELHPVLAPVMPTVSIEDPVDFGTLTWNGTDYGSATRSTTVTVMCQGVCMDSHSIQISIEGAETGIHPQLTNAEVSGNGLSSRATSGAPATEAVTIAQTSSGTMVNGTIDLDLILAPDNDAEPGEYDMTIKVSVVDGQ